VALADDRTNKDADEPANETEHESAKYAPPEAIDDETEAEEARDPAREQKEQTVDHESKQPQSQNIQREGDDANEVAQHSIDDSKDSGDEQEGQHDLKGSSGRERHNLDPGNNHRSKPQSKSIDQQAHDDSHALTMHPPFRKPQWLLASRLVT